MKERNRKGKFRAAETVAYKMTQHHGFDQVSWQAFQEAAAEKYDFTTCQRSDGSKYGSKGRCIKGSETSPASKDDKKGSSKSGGGGGDVATAPAPKKTTKKDPVKNVLNEQKKTADLKKGMDADVTAKAKAGKIKGVDKGAVDRINAKKSGGATLDKASRNEYNRQAKREQQEAKDIKDEMKRNGKTPELEKKLKQTEERAAKFERMSKTGVFEPPKKK